MSLGGHSKATLGPGTQTPALQLMFLHFYLFIYSQVYWVFVVVYRLLTAVVSLVAEPRIQNAGFVWVQNVRVQ